MISTLNRRQFLKFGGAMAGRAVAGSSLLALGCDLSHYGPLGEADENGIRLPAGFRSRILAVSGQAPAGTAYAWHSAPDGGAVFETRDGWIYVSNSERSVGGGAGALRFDRAGELVDAYPICRGTRRNCAGGATPWDTWLSCEEVSLGRVFECDPFGGRAAVALPALGSFKHEAVAVDPLDRRLYLTEDEFDGRLYRFTPNRWGALDGGVLAVARVDPAGRVTWLPVPDPNPTASGTPTRRQVPLSRAFAGGEGIDYADGHVYFVTKFDNRVWDLDIDRQLLGIVYERATDALGQLSGVDNLLVTPEGDLMVAEDGGNMELVELGPEGVGLALLRVENQSTSELAGPAFDPSGTRLYFSSQRGFDGRGITYEVRGPFRSRRRNPRSLNRSSI